MNELADNALQVVNYLFDLYKEILPTLQTFSLLITGILLFFVALAMMEANVIGGKKDKFIDKWNLTDMSKAKVKKAWDEILRGVGSGESVKMKKAINDADKILEEALRERGFAGKTMDERLNRVDESKMANLKEVWQAHRLSERIKKEPALGLTQSEAWNIIHIYEQTFKDHGLID